MAKHNVKVNVSYNETYLINNICKIMDDDNPNVQDSYGNTCLHIACKTGLKDIVKQLLNHQNIQPNIQNNLYKTPFREAFDNVNIELIKIMMDDPRIDIDVRPIKSQSGYSGVAYTNYELIKLMYHDNRSTFHLQDDIGMTIMHILCMFRQIDIMKLFLDDNRFDINLADSEGRTPLHQAIDQKCYEIVKLLVNDLNINKTITFNGLTPLMRAVLGYNFSSKFDYDLIQFLLENNADPKMCDSYGNTLLHMAFANTNTDLKLIKLLLEIGLDPNAQNNEKQTPMIKFCYDIDNHSVDKLLILMDHPKLDPYIQDDKGNTALHYACYKYNNEIIKLILEYYPLYKLNIKNNNGDTPIKCAINIGNIDAIKLLNLNIDEISKLKDSPYHVPCILNDIDEVKLLLDAGCDPNVQNIDGETPLLYACRFANLDIVKLLLKCEDIKVNLYDYEYKYTPLHEICHILFLNKHYNNNIINDDIICEIIYHLLSHPDIDLNIINCNSDTPFHKLCGQCKCDKCETGCVLDGSVFELFINSSKFDPNVQTKSGNTCLHICANNQRYKVISLLTEHPNINFNVQNSIGNTPFHVLCRLMDFSVLKLPFNSIGLNIKNKSNLTGLDMLCDDNYYDNYDTIKYLLDKFDDLEFSDKLLKGNKKINKMLREYKKKKKLTEEFD